MKLTGPACAALLLLCGSIASAQQPVPYANYEVTSRWHDDPAQAVRRKAELRTAQRMQRLAAMKWFGLSNARPQAAATPFTSVYSPAWIGNGYHRYEWVGSGYPTRTVLVESDDYQR